MIIPILAVVANTFATISGKAVSSIPAVGSDIAKVTAATGAAAGKAIGKNVVETAIVAGATTTACNIVALLAAKKIKDIAAKSIKEPLLLE